MTTSRIEDLTRARRERLAAAPLTVDQVLQQWRAEGALRHEPTGLQRLDELTGGGPVYGSRWYVLGAPDAGKTAFFVQLAETWLRAGVNVGILAVDEDPGDVVSRVMQRQGYTRAECEDRSAEVVEDMRRSAEDLSRLRIYDASWTIERAGEDIARQAGPTGRAALLVDSIQTVTCEAEVGAYSQPREAVTMRVGALRAVATRWRLIALATSEMGRRGYSGGDDERGGLADLAAAKESGAIEYSARVMLALRPVEGEEGLVELRIAKNKHGPRDERVGLRLDRRLQTLIEASLPAAKDRRAEAEARKVEAGKASVARAAAALAAILAETGGLIRRDLAGAMRARLGACGTALPAAALHRLGSAVVERPQGRSTVYHVDGSRLPAEVVAALAQIEGVERSKVLGARPPAEVPL